MNRIQQFWFSQAKAEYSSAAIASDFAHALCCAGVVPELVRQSLQIAQDELVHAQMAYQVAQMSGVTTPISLEGMQLGIVATNASLQENLLETLIVFFCLGETVAVPLFAAMKNKNQQEQVLATYTRILQDEPRHSSFGWLCLAWIDQNWPDARAKIPTFFYKGLSSIASQYYCVNDETSELTILEKYWGMLPPLRYAEIFENTILSLYNRHLEPYQINVTEVWREIQRNLNKVA